MGRWIQSIDKGLINVNSQIRVPDRSNESSFAIRIIRPNRQYIWLW